MAETDKAETRAISVRWPLGDYERIEQAAQALTEQMQIKVTPTDIVRSGALLKADQVLGAA